MLPPLCDNPTSEYFYNNDCRPPESYQSSIKNIAVPRLIIRGGNMLNTNQYIICKDDEVLKTCRDLANKYY